MLRRPPGLHHVGIDNHLTGTTTESTKAVGVRIRHAKAGSEDAAPLQIEVELAQRRIACVQLV